ncbi:hypothetical protein F2Q69_00031335 [Brassica cretica]|uniref:Uncharacterized protein n=1 Tax=Brassica cretica TaxID=69181 RepID=A0A8S9SB60_BRACR|nr:hypothetical protein F2Q69_00031335 [Brassica cretica]
MITACGVTHRSTRWNGQARGVAMHATRPCGQTCGGRGVSLHRARPCSQTGRGRGVIQHETEICSQPCGARGSDTRAATRLVSDCTWIRFCSSEERSVLVENSSRSVWTWVYLRRSRKGSDRRSRVWGQGHGQPKTAYWGELVFLQTSYPVGSRKPFIRWIGKTQANGVMSYGCVLHDGEDRILPIVKEEHNVTRAQVTSSELVEVAGS